MSKIAFYHDDSQSISQEQVDEFLQLIKIVVASQPIAADYQGLPTWKEEPLKASVFILDDSVMKEQFGRYQIEPEEEDTIRNILRQHKCQTIDQLMELHDCKFEDNWHMQHVRNVLRQRFESRPKPRAQCDCGSKHTSFPNHHYYWCSVRQWEKG